MQTGRVQVLLHALVVVYLCGDRNWHRLAVAAPTELSRLAVDQDKEKQVRTNTPHWFCHAKHSKPTERMTHSRATQGDDIITNVFDPRRTSLG